MISDDAVGPPGGEKSPDQMVVVFPLGLWPYRAELDRVSFLLAQGIANALSQVPGLLGYSSPRGLIDPAAADPGSGKPIRVFHSLVPLTIVRQECEVLGARWALTGRLLTDRKGIEIWLNLLDGRTGHLLWTDRIVPPRERVLWLLTGLIRSVVKVLGLYSWVRIELTGAFATGSWGSLLAYAGAQDRCLTWRGDPATGVEAFRWASRAVALDPGFVAACQLFSELGERLLASAKNEEECRLIRNAIVGTGDIETVRKMLHQAHDRILALAKGVRET